MGALHRKPIILAAGKSRLKAMVHPLPWLERWRARWRLSQDHHLGAKSTFRNRDLGTFSETGIALERWSLSDLSRDIPATIDAFGASLRWADPHRYNGRFTPNGQECIKLFAASLTRCFGSGALLCILFFSASVYDPTH